MKELVKHPSHYQLKCGVETMDLIAELIENYSGIKAFMLGNCIKYLCRAGKKESETDIRDYEKAANYLNMFIAELKK